MNDTMMPCADDHAVKNNAILIAEINGEVVHRFCRDDFARAQLEAAGKAGSGAMCLTMESGLGAELTYDLSPDVRSRVAEAKGKLRRDLKVRDVLDNHGVPQDRDIRIAVNKAIAALQDEGFF